MMYDAVMGNPIVNIPAPAPKAPGEGSAMRRFLAERGVIMMKENRSIAKVTTTQIVPLEISGQILVIVKGAERELSVGVKFEQAETNSHLESAAFLDQDEVDEFLGACTFIIKASTQMVHDSRDYTEVMYSTRDDVMIGFYQQGHSPKAFVRLGAINPTMFFRLDALEEIRDAVAQARTHVMARRVAWETR